MHSESLSLLLSFLSILAISSAFVLLGCGISTKLNGHPWPKTAELMQSLIWSGLITVVITLSICLVMRWVGFFEMQFFRPSQRDFGQREELNLQVEEIEVPTSSGNFLHGWIIAADQESRGTILCFHGSDLNITYTVKNVSWLAAEGIDVIVFDYRGFGKSPGTPDRSGVIEDSMTMVEWARNTRGVSDDRLVLYGQSMGGQLAIIAAARSPDFNPALVISEATYASPSHHLCDKLGQLGPLWLVSWGAWLTTPNGDHAAEAVSDLSGVPLLLVHGTADRGVAPYHAERIYAAAGDPKEFWKLEGAEHLRIFTEEQNRQRLVDYLHEHLPELESLSPDGANTN